MESNSTVTMRLPPPDGAERPRGEVLVALDGGEPHLAVQLGHLFDAEVAELVVVALDEAERLVRSVELEQPPVPSVHAREVVGVDCGVLCPVLLVEPRCRLGDFLGHQLLHVFLRSGQPALNISPLRAKPHRSEGGSREVHDDLHQPERSGGLCGVSWAPLTRRSGGATRPRSRGHTTAYAAYRQQKGPPSDLKGNDRLQGKARIPTLEPGAGYQTGFLISAESKAQTHQRLDSRRSWTIALSRYRIVSHRPNLTAYC